MEKKITRTLDDNKFLTALSFSPPARLPVCVPCRAAAVIAEPHITR